MSQTHSLARHHFAIKVRMEQKDEVIFLVLSDPDMFQEGIVVILRKLECLKHCDLKINSTEWDQLPHLATIYVR